jgi:hypothetical protein
MTNYYSEECRNLYKQVIKRAIRDCIIKKEELKHGRSWMEELVCDPEYYLFESEEEALPSFIGICHLFNCDPEFLRGAIKTWLEQKEVDVGQSALEQLKTKIKREREVQRNELNIWGWGRLRVKKKGLDELVDTLLTDDVIREYAVRTETGRIKRYYVWVEK